MNNKMNKRLREKGAAAVEFALILPILLTLVFGIIEFGVMLYNKAVMTNASREIARQAILFQTPRRDVTAATQTFLNTNLIRWNTTRVSTISTTPAIAGLTNGTPLTVTVTFVHDFLVINALIPPLGANVNLVANTTMRAE